MVHRGLGNQLNQLLNRMVVGHQAAARKALDRPLEGLRLRKLEKYLEGPIRDQ